MIEKDDLEDDFPIINYEKCFKLVKDGKKIGIGAINIDKENLIYIYIKQELRGNGYGKFLFSKVLDEVKKSGNREARLAFSKDNIQMIKIVNDNGGIHVSTNKNIIKYVIPLIF